ncbi:type II secretion system F family protein [Halapricum desulfuricans]|uniref:Pilus assembly protein TadC n=1 Tax=Halapricum desulfuricans TaxID=2841257 RepID=A0A897MW91_9EURY|nr:type II secretion system F family protein [Halapricum desulfuricans]QSG04737.1 Pilus assembly protein TadC [Halapricum desulfuricans]
MSRPTGDTEPSEFGFQQFPYVQEAPGLDEAQLREHYGWFRGYYKARPRRYFDLQRWLNQARYGQSFDVYLARSAWYAMGGIAAGAVFGLAVAWLLAASGVVEGLTNPLAYDGAVVYYIADYKALFAGAALATVFAAAFGFGTWYVRYHYPRLVVSSRRRNIDVTLPHAIVFMYALSRGGMDLLEVFGVLADSEETYGEVANEAEMVVREVELFGNDMFTALRNVRSLTPSENFEQFLDDLLSMLDSGGDVTVFFEDEAESYLEEARDEQQSFLETLGLLSEFFVVLFVAAPLFVIVILVVMSLLGAQTLAELTLLVYVMLPLAMVGFLVLLDTLSEPYVQPEVRFGDDEEDIESGLALLWAVVRDAIPGVRPRPSAATAMSAECQSRQGSYLAHRRRRALRATLADPLAAFRAKPVWTVAVTAPLAVLVGWGFVAAGLATPTWEAMLERPIPTTTWLFVLPLLVVLVPLSAFHERKRRREQYFATRFPDTLSILASANKMGIPIDEALGLASRWSSGPLSEEMATLRNDLRWNHDTRSGLRSFADRVGVAQLSRTMTLIAEGIRSSTDVAAVLTIAARDTKERFKLDRERRQELSPYIAVVVIGFLVFLLVVALLDAAYLAPIADAQAEATAPAAGESDLPLSMTAVPVEAYKALFLHAAVVQALGSGVLAGKLASDDAFSGLKYSIVLLVVAIATFALI